ncbi:HEPN domain-containing protein [Sphingomonas sp. UNC305MFCol5.2]|uniref:HEPN domain-containing protein n=1 Tax=Sphingomonas sp. UNC305MFCol5.2 TaxID=1449076 RepID=UPI0004A72DD1|nr:HEPN domain-containing protein [Sphingomonas sp. UNC305MFCol5.2]
MRNDVDHLPTTQQDELVRVVATLREEFSRAIAMATQPWKKNGKILKIILFGSYAREDWVDEPENGYQSDFDLLVIVSHEDLTDIADYWYVAEDLILHDAAVGRPVNIIVHTLNEVNQALERGEYFWVDIARDGIALYELPNHALTAPKPLKPADAVEMAVGYFNTQIRATDRWMKLALVSQAESDADGDWVRNAAFNFHQATETAYACFLLVWTLYFPRSHNIKFLRSLSEDKDHRLVAAWPRATRMDRRRFELLKRAYVEARYSSSYEIAAEDLDAIAVSVKQLRDVVEQLCRERLDQLRAEAGIAN